MKVLWIVDNKLRELYGLYNLKNNFKKRGLSLIIVNKANWCSAVKFYNPSLVISPNIKSLGKSIIKFCKIRNIKTIHYSSEGLNYQKSKLSELYPTDFTNLFDYLLCWSDEEKKYLDSLGYKDKTLTIGNFKYMKRNSNKLKIKVIGISTSSRYFTSRYDKNIFSVISDRPKNSRAWGNLHNEIDYIYFITDLIKKLILNNFKVIIRPHPFEDPKIYKKAFKDCEIDSSNNAYDFINKVDLVINQFSSISVEALYANKPVISIFKNIPIHEGLSFMKGFIPAHFGRNFKNSESILEFLISNNSTLSDYCNKEDIKLIDLIAPNINTEKILTDLIKKIEIKKKNTNYLYFFEFLLKELYVQVFRKGSTFFCPFKPSDYKILKDFKL